MSDADHKLNLTTLLSALQNADCYDHPVEKFELVETHISYVLLTGSFAYKFKKSVNLGFLDFSTLEKRKFYLDEEFRLNKRLAPALYLDVVPVSGSESSPTLKYNGEPIIEYALKMVQFNVQDQLDVLIEQNKVLPEHINQLAEIIANFHMSLKPAGLESDYGRYEKICYPVMENFDQIQAEEHETDLIKTLSEIKAWSTEQLELLKPIFNQRKKQGCIRECHGDMHLSNIVLIEDQIVIFDCIEFNEQFRWIDVISELAFALMDLNFRHRDEFANRLLNSYLERTGDYAGLQVLNFYRIYRSMVRAKVADIQRSQNKANYAKLTERLIDHVRLAQSYIQDQAKPFLCITHGFSGSGKTFHTDQLVDLSASIRIRSDVERKRLFDLKAETRASEAIGEGLYHEDINTKTYDQLANLTQIIINSGYPVIVDATFLKKNKRDQFNKLARDLSVPFYILSFTASVENLKNRIIKRDSVGKDASDADLAVLNHQLKSHDEITDEEKQYTININTEIIFDPAEIVITLHR